MPITVSLIGLVTVLIATQKTAKFVVLDFGF